MLPDIAPRAYLFLEKRGTLRNAVGSLFEHCRCQDPVVQVCVACIGCSSGPNQGCVPGSIVLTMLALIGLTVLVAIVLLRALRRDISRYNEAPEDDGFEDYGWKLIRGDVFRPPGGRMVLAAFVGAGSQLFLMLLVTLGIVVVYGRIAPAY